MPVLMIKNLSLLKALLFLSFFSFSAYGQQKYTTRYFPLTKVSNKPGLVIIECKPDMYDYNIKMFTDAKILKGVPLDKYGYETLKNFKVLKGDSLLLFARYFGKGKSCGNVSFAIKKKMIRVDEVYSQSVMVYELIARPGACMLKPGDMIAMEVINQYNDSMLLFRIANYHINIPNEISQQLAGISGSIAILLSNRRNVDHQIHTGRSETCCSFL